MAQTHFFLCLLFVALAACDGRPSREKFPGPRGATTDLKTGNQGAVMGGFDPNAAAPVETHDAAPRQPSGGSVEGVISLGKGVQPKPGMVLYISVRPLSGGRPVAARRLPLPQKFPVDFVVSASDVMVPGTPFAGDVLVTARLDQDGNPLSQQKGDAFGSLDTKVGAKGLKLLIDTPVED